MNGHFGQKKILVPFLIVVIGAGAFLFLWFWSSHREGATPPSSSDVVATVQGKTLTEQDLADHDRIVNGPARLAHNTDPNVPLASREDVLKQLVNATLLALEAERRGISVSDAEISARKNPSAIAFLPAYGWSEADYDESIRQGIVREKVEDAITMWRDAEFVSIRFDVLPEQHAPLTLEEFQAKATSFLETVKSDLAAGKDAQSLALRLIADPEVAKLFPQNAIQYRSFTTPPAGQRRPHIAYAPFNQQLLSADEHIMSMKYPTAAEIWCAKDACYLIRVISGNDGAYKTLDEWLHAQPR